MEWINGLMLLFCGAILGVIVTTLFKKHQNQLQPIGYKLTINPTPDTLTDKTITKFTDTKTGKIYDYVNVFSATVKLQNIGNKDLNEIIIGISALGNMDILGVDIIPQDRYHIGKCLTEFNNSNLKSEVDIELKPFNQKDYYVINFYLLLPVSCDKVEIENIKFISPNRIKFQKQNFK